MFQIRNTGGVGGGGDLSSGGGAFVSHRQGWDSRGYNPTQHGNIRLFQLIFKYSVLLWGKRFYIRNVEQCPYQLFRMMTASGTTNGMTSRWAVTMTTTNRKGRPEPQDEAPMDPVLRSPSISTYVSEICKYNRRLTVELKVESSRCRSIEQSKHW